jgi:putative endonuclease
MVTAMTFWVYVLESETTGKIYIGHTSDLERRLREHNDGESGKLRYTRKQMGPWRLAYSEDWTTRSEAMRREKELKSGQGREWLVHCPRTKKGELALITANSP